MKKNIMIINADREAAQTVKDNLACPSTNLVLVHSITRVGREWGMTLRYIDLLAEHGVKLLCVRERLLFSEKGVTAF